MHVTFDIAYALAQRGHASQRYGDQPYMFHIDEVIAEARALIAMLPPDALAPQNIEKILIVAANHDLVEDTDLTGVTYADLIQHGYDEDVIGWLKRLDNGHKVGTYQENIAAMAQEGEIAVIITKLADNRRNRFHSTAPEHQGKLRRYERAGAVLEAAYESFKDAAWARHRENV